MMPPTLWASVPFRNPTAFSDLVGTVELWFHGLADAVFDLTGTAIRTPPLGAGGSRAWLLDLQAAFVEANAALATTPPGDLASYDLSDEADFTGWTFLLSQEGDRLRINAGLP